MPRSKTKPVRYHPAPQMMNKEEFKRLLQEVVQKQKEEMNGVEISDEAMDALMQAAQTKPA